MQYKITGVNPQTKPYDSKFGPMIAYEVMFEGVQDKVQISQKADSRPPAAGDLLEGTIDMSGPFGPKFKKDFNQGKSFGSASTGGGFSPKSSPKKEQDPFTMYLSYAKDLAVGLVSKDGFDEKQYAELLEAVLTGGKILYEGRPSNDTPAAASPQATDSQNFSTNTLMNDAELKSLEQAGPAEDPWAN